MFIKIDAPDPPPFESKYPCEFGVQIKWPMQIRYKKLMYYWYNKVGLTSKGVPCACFQNDASGGDLRIWLDCEGNIIED